MGQNVNQHVMVINKVERKAKYQESNWGSDKNTIKYNTQESLEFSLFSADDHKLGYKERQDRITKIKMKHK